MPFNLIGTPVISESSIEIALWIQVDELYSMSAFGLDIEIDPRLTFDKVEKGDLTTDWATVAGNTINSSLIRVGGYAGAAAPIDSIESGVLFILHFIAPGRGDYRFVFKNYVDKLARFSPNPLILSINEGRMIIERIGSCNDCNLCSEKRVVLPAALICGVGFISTTATPSPQYRICSIRFRIKEWGFVGPVPDFDIIGMKFANLITISPGDRDTWPDEITIERQGACLQCGFCCGWRNNKLSEYGCSHIITTGSKKGECSIYENLADYCVEHGHTHEDCIPPPSQPNRFWNQDCGYKFIVTTPDLPITGNEVIRFYYISPGQNPTIGSWVRDENIS